MERLKEIARWTNVAALSMFVCALGFVPATVLGILATPKGGPADWGLLTVAICLGVPGVIAGAAWLYAEGKLCAPWAEHLESIRRGDYPDGDAHNVLAIPDDRPLELKTFREFWMAWLEDHPSMLRYDVPENGGRETIRFPARPGVVKMFVVSDPDGRSLLEEAFIIVVRRAVGAVEGVGGVYVMPETRQLVDLDFRVVSAMASR